MPEIQLPTAAKQDEILSKIQKVNDDFILDLSKTQLMSTNTATEHLTSYFSVAGPGALRTVLNSSSNSSCKVIFQIDDGKMFSFILPPSASFNVNIAFKTSLKMSLGSPGDIELFYTLD